MRTGRPPSLNRRKRCHSAFRIQDSTEQVRLLHRSDEHINHHDRHEEHKAHEQKVQKRALEREVAFLQLIAPGLFKHLRAELAHHHTKYVDARTHLSKPKQRTTHKLLFSSFVLLSLSLQMEALFPISRKRTMQENLVKDRDE
jgi:hypothetical protein